MIVSCTQYMKLIVKEHSTNHFYSFYALNFFFFEANNLTMLSVLLFFVIPLSNDFGNICIAYKRK